MTPQSDTIRCRDCETPKPRQEFRRRGSAANGRRSTCRDCEATAQRERRRKQAVRRETLPFYMR